MLSTLLLSAQREHLLTIESMRCALIDAGCAHTSIGHVHGLLHGKAKPSAEEWAALMDHLTPDGVARAAAAVCGLSVSSASTARQGSVVMSAMRASCAAATATMAAHEAMADGRITSGERTKIRAALVSTRDEAVVALADLDAVVVQ